MTRLEHQLELVSDLRDCAGRLRDMGYQGFAEDLYHAANETEHMAKASLPPALASNQEARATACKHFRAARKLLENIK